MPKVKLNLFATLRAYSNGRPSVEVDFEPNQTVGDILQSVGVPLEQTRILLVNHRHATTSQPLQPDDQISAFPAIGGG